MKKSGFALLFGITFLGFFPGYSQDTVKFSGMRDFYDHVTHTFKDNHPDLSFFKYRVISTDGNIYDWYNGRNNNSDSITNIIGYLNAVKDLELSNFNPDDSSVRFGRLQRDMVMYLQEGLTPISLSFVEYSDFKDSSIMLNLIGWQNNQFTETVVNGYYPFSKKKFFTASALNHVLKNPPLNFYIDDNLILSNIKEKIDSVYINFGDSLGFVPLRKGAVYQVSYNSPGLKTCTVKLKSDSNYYYSRFQVYDSTARGSQNKLENTNSTSSCNTPITPPDIPPAAISVTQGNLTVSGKYAIWFSTCNSNRKLRKPYIISNGFNPGNGKQLVPFATTPNDIVVNVNGTTITLPVTYGWRGTLYELFNGGYEKWFSPTEASQCGEGSSNQNRYLDRLRDEGYDIVIMMNDNGTDYVENNALLIEKVINTVNSIKYANGYYFENVVSGYSLGGVSSRLALDNMELKYKAGLGPHPHTKIWVSFESENQASNFPLGLGYFIDFQADPNTALPTLAGGANAIQVAADWANRQAANLTQSFSNNPTSRELVLYTPSSPAGPTSDRINLQNLFNSIPGTPNGYPGFVRRIGVAQGSSLGTQVPHGSPELIDTQLKMDPLGDSYTESDCSGSYTVYRPVAKKTTTARYWSSNNNQNIFDGNVYINANWTYLKRQCTSGSVAGVSYCICLGPFIWAGQNTTIADKHVAKPLPNVNYDDVPGSTLFSHLEVYNTSAYKFYNNWFAGNSYANHDPHMHAFAPTVSLLDLHNPVTGQPENNFTSPASLGLMNIKPLTEPLPTEPNLRYGFPYISYPTNHYQVTPFDAVYAIGTNNGTDVNSNPRPDNQEHVSDPQTFIGDYLARVEVAPTELYLSNQTVGASASSYPGYSGGYKAEFEARNKIIMGKTDILGANIYSLYGNQNFLTPNGDFNVAIGTTAIFHSADLEILAGVGVPLGAEFEAYIQPYTCTDLLFRKDQANEPGHPKGYSNIMSGLNYSTEKPVTKQEVQTQQLTVYPNPNNGLFTVINNSNKPVSLVSVTDIAGKEVYRGEMNGNETRELDVRYLSNGIYLLRIGDERFKLVISK